MRLGIAALICLSSTLVCAKLPPPTEEVKAKAAEAGAKSAWGDKVGLYQLCVSMDRTAAAYRKTTKAKDKWGHPLAGRCQASTRISRCYCDNVCDLSTAAGVAFQTSPNARRGGQVTR